jgi:hypothetical protein
VFTSTRLIGLILLVGGVIVLGIAYNQSGTFGDQAKHAFTGDYSDRTTWLTVIGAVASLLGFAALVVPFRRGVA